MLSFNSNALDSMCIFFSTLIPLDFGYKWKHYLFLKRLYLQVIILIVYYFAVFSFDRNKKVDYIRKIKIKEKNSNPIGIK